MSNWKRRHKVHCVKLCGESGSAPAENVELSRSALPKIIEQYDPKDCFIGDESGWFYRQTVSIIYIHGSVSENMKSGVHIL